MSFSYADLNWDEVEESQEGGKVMFPSGVVKVQITKEDLRPANGKTMDTHAIQEFTFEVIEGQFKGATIKQMYNMLNPNETATRISRAMVKQIGMAVGVLPDGKIPVAAMMNKPFKVVVEHKVDDNRTYVDRNNVTRKSINTNFKKFYSIQSQVDGESQPQSSYQDFVKSLNGSDTVGSGVATPASRPVPTAPKTAPPPASLRTPPKMVTATPVVAEDDVEIPFN